MVGPSARSSTVLDRSRNLAMESPETPESQQHEQEDLHGRVTRSVGWVMVSQLTIQVLALITSIVVARLLGPFEVGLAAAALVFGSLALIIANFGFAAAIIQRPTLTEADKSTVFWVGTGLGVLLTLISIGLSWPIADLYGQPRVQPLFAVLSGAFLFSALGIVQSGLLVRDLQFRSLEIRTIVATTASGAAAIAVAAAGGGAWAIIVQDLVITSVSTALLWRASRWRPKLIFSRESLRDMIGYSSHVAGTQILGWATVSLDNFLIGRYLGPAPLGAYTIAFSVMTTPLKRITIPLSTVFFPAFSAMRDPARIAAGWLRATRMTAFVVVPLTLGVIPVAPDMVDVVFGDAWGQAVPLIQILAGVGLLQAVISLCHSTLQAVARTRELFRFTLVLSVATVAAFAIGLTGGVEGVAWAYLLVSMLLQPVLVLVTTRALDLTFGDWLRSLAGVLQAGLTMLAMVLAVRELVLPADTDSLVRLAVLLAVGAAVYLPMILWREPEVRSEIEDIRRRRTRAEPAKLVEPTR